MCRKGLSHVLHRSSTWRCRGFGFDPGRCGVLARTISNVNEGDEVTLEFVGINGDTPAPRGGLRDRRAGREKPPLGGERLRVASLANYRLPSDHHRGVRCNNDSGACNIGLSRGELECHFTANVAFARKVPPCLRSMQAYQPANRWVRSSAARRPRLPNEATPRPSLAFDDPSMVRGIHQIVDLAASSRLPAMPPFCALETGIHELWLCAEGISWPLLCASATAQATGMARRSDRSCCLG
jgi:hypothetical protein